jgi:PiT family inorganic phosphate transporter
MDMVHLRPYQGFSADFAAALCLLLSSLTGIRLHHAYEDDGIMGVGAAHGSRPSNGSSSATWS